MPRNSRGLWRPWRCSPTGRSGWTRRPAPRPRRSGGSAPSSPSEWEKHIGGIYDFLRRKKIENLKEIEKKEKKTVLVSGDNPSVNKQRYLEKKEYEKSIRKLRKRLEDTENEIENIENEINAIDKSFMEPGNSTEEHNQAFERYRELKEILNQSMEKWAEYSQELEEYLKTNNQ